ncbi:MAG TPA: tetratricopeptide repeat protein [Candidatus Dormibacteraeota bacterium]|nr:tetratricopeptide repeat protein [Candidatus Dormibacteraeota bacterium]
MDRLDDGKAPWSAGKILIDQGRFEAARIAFNDAVQGFERSVGHDHVWTAFAMSREGWCNLALGRPEAAVPLCREALEIFRRQVDGVWKQSVDDLAQYEDLLADAMRRAEGA